MSKPDSGPTKGVAKRYKYASISTGLSTTQASASRLVDRKALPPEPVACEHDTRRRRARRAPVDHRVADQHGRLGRHAGRRHQVRQSRRIGFARKRSIAADDAVRRKISREIQTRRESGCAAASGLLVSTASDGAARELIEQLRNSRIRSRVAQAAGRRRSSESDRAHRAAVRRRRRQTRER